MNDMTVDLTLPKIGKEMLQNLSSKKIAPAEFDREIAYWLLKTVGDLHYQGEPIAPDDMREYQQRKSRDNKYQVSDSFWQQDHIRKYIAVDSHIRCANSGSIFWLEFMRKNIPSGDIMAHAKIAAALRTHGIMAKVAPKEIYA